MSTKRVTIEEQKFIKEKIQKGYVDLIAFRKEFLLEEDETDGEFPSPDFHYEWSDILLKGEKNFAIEAFRESAKTQYIMRSFPLYALMFPERKRRYFLIVCRGEEQAGKRLKEITREYQSNKWLKNNLYRVVEDSANAFECKAFDYKGRLLDIRIEAYGKGSGIRGAAWKNLRPQLILIDDLQNKDDMDSEKTLERDWDWFLDDVKFLASRCRIFMLSNNLGEKCIIEQIFRSEGNFGFECRIIPRITSLDDKGIPTWAGKDTREKILAEYSEYSKARKASIWVRNNMCECVAGEDKIFNTEWFRYFPVSETENIASTCNIFCRGDLSLTSKATGDYSAFAIVGVNSLNYWYVLDFYYGHYSLDERIDVIFEINRKWQPMNFGIENTSGADLLINEVRKQMPVRNNFIKDLFECTHGGKKKELRIEAMQPRFASGTVWFPDSAEWLPELQAELAMFTRMGLTTLHDDLIDALAYMEQKTYAPVNNSDGSKRNFNPYRQPKLKIKRKCIIK